jgi:hypothetical protein
VYTSFWITLYKESVSQSQSSCSGLSNFPVLIKSWFPQIVCCFVFCSSKSNFLMQVEVLLLTGILAVSCGSSFIVIHNCFVHIRQVSVFCTVDSAGAADTSNISCSVFWYWCRYSTLYRPIHRSALRVVLSIGELTLMHDFYWKRNSYLAVKKIPALAEPEGSLTVNRNSQLDPIRCHFIPFRTLTLYFSMYLV